MSDTETEQVPAKTAKGSNERIPALLAVTTLGGFFAYLLGVTFLPVSTDAGIVNLGIGWLGGSASTVIAYYFGSSAGRDLKPDATPDKK